MVRGHACWNVWILGWKYLMIVNTISNKISQTPYGTQYTNIRHGKMPTKILLKYHQHGGFFHGNLGWELDPCGTWPPTPSTTDVHRAWRSLHSLRSTRRSTHRQVSIFSGESWVWDSRELMEKPIKVFLHNEVVRKNQLSWLNYTNIHIMKLLNLGIMISHHKRFNHWTTCIDIESQSLGGWGVVFPKCELQLKFT